MDNLTHTMAGVLLAECGLKRRSPLAYPALLIGANLPDIDILSYILGGSLAALEFRRGWTHGVLALVVLPVVLAVLLTGWDRLRRRRWSLESRASDARVTFAPLVAVSAIAIISHPLLDLVNNYGVRLLMPFSDRWFYGDAIYIIDPWILILLIGGTLLARRRHVERRRAVFIARTALALLLAYIASMTYISHASSRAVAREAGLDVMPGQRLLMMSPDPVRVASRSGLLDSGASYERWHVSWRPWGSLARRLDERVPKGMDDPRALRAMATRDGRGYLAWSRFPYVVSGVDGDSLAIHLGDARYSEGVAPNWASIRVRIPAAEP